MSHEPAPICGVLLAAGSSRRFGAANKLLADVGGVPLVRRAAEALRDSKVADVVVVTGPDPERIATALSGLDVRFVHNEAFADGIGGSIATGASALRPGTAGVVIVQGDMPALTTALIDRLIAAFLAAGADRLTFPVLADGSQRNPVIWPSSAFADLRALKGDRGAKALAEARRATAVTGTVADDDAFADIDTEAELRAWQDRNPSLTSPRTAR
jgi:molybdenum cofactor cytidylyltransferase